MQAFPAEKYMSGPKAEAILSRTGPKKTKKKRKADSDGGPSAFIDEDAGFGDERARWEQGEKLDAAQAVVASGGSFKGRQSNWHSGGTTVCTGGESSDSRV
ncbi:hypothetical protein EDD16DRAFT_1681376 [Pisolithus croceorrhizus]|nr:hypothetical protein EDD16DRAFT_1681376 [Pisolithus croceorrhizus]KAI6168047.1 hypothetical protein EDD17DRAFT_1531529 [Pisolithus thermaeus]